MGFFRSALVVMMKDLRAEMRTKEAINASLGFAIVILLLFSFAFDPEADTTKALSGGLLWIVFAFAGTLILNQLRPRTAQRLPGRPDRRAHFRRRTIPWKSAGELRSAAGRGAGLAAGFRHLL